MERYSQIKNYFLNKKYKNSYFLFGAIYNKSIKNSKIYYY